MEKIFHIIDTSGSFQSLPIYQEMFQCIAALSGGNVIYASNTSEVPNNMEEVTFHTSLRFKEHFLKTSRSYDKIESVEKFAFTNGFENIMIWTDLPPILLMSQNLKRTIWLINKNNLPSHSHDNDSFKEISLNECLSLVAQKEKTEIKENIGTLALKKQKIL